MAAVRTPPRRPRLRRLRCSAPRRRSPSSSATRASRLDAPPGFADTSFTGSPRLQELAESADLGLQPRAAVRPVATRDLRRFTVGDQIEAQRYMVVATPQGLGARQRERGELHQASASDSLRDLGSAPPAGTDYAAYLDTQPPGQRRPARRAGATSQTWSRSCRARACRRQRRDEPPSYVLSSTTLLLVRGKALSLAVYTAYETADDVEWIRCITAALDRGAEAAEQPLAAWAGSSCSSRSPPRRRLAARAIRRKATRARRTPLRAALERLAPQQPGRIDLYALVVGGDAEEVFRREVEAVREVLDARLGTAGRSVAMVNDLTQPQPEVTLNSLAYALRALARRMDPEEDVLLLHLTSHGLRNHELSLRHPALPLYALSPLYLRSLLDEAGVRNRVVIVSACFSGGFVGPLSTGDTMVLTAASADRPSYGCGSDSKIDRFLARAVPEGPRQDALAARGRGADPRPGARGREGARLQPFAAAAALRPRDRGAAAAARAPARGAARPRKPSSAATKAAGSSTCGQCPQPFSSTYFAPRMPSASWRASAGGVVASSLPAMTSVGLLDPLACIFDRVQPRQRKAGGREARRVGLWRAQPCARRPPPGAAAMKGAGSMRWIAASSTAAMPCDDTRPAMR